MKSFILSNESLLALIVVHFGQEWVVEELLDREALLLVLHQALVDEILEVARPALIVDLSVVSVDDSVDQLFSIKSAERRLTSCKLECVATIAPHVNLLAVDLTSMDLGTDPV